MLRLRTFGGLSVEGATGPLGGAAIPRQGLALLALLAGAGERGLSRDKLLAVMWPESDAERARHALNQALYVLRRTLREDELVLGTGELRLNPERISSDIAELESAFEAGAFDRADALYAGPFLDG